MPRPLALVLSWLVVTVMATALVWAGVEVVAGRVVDPIEPLTTPATQAAPQPDNGSSPSPLPTTTAAAIETRSYDLVGGTVTVRFSAAEVELVSASPADGFALRPVEQEGPTDIRVEFRRTDDTWRSRLRATWDGGPEERIDERDRR